MMRNFILPYINISTKVWWRNRCFFIDRSKYPFARPCEKDRPSFRKRQFHVALRLLYGDSLSSTRRHNTRAYFTLTVSFLILTLYMYVCILMYFSRCVSYSSRRKKKKKRFQRR